MYGYIMREMMPLGEDPMTERGLVVVAAGPTGSEPCRPGPAGVPIGEGNVTVCEAVVPHEFSCSLFLF